MNLAIDFSGEKLDSCLMNASGVNCMTIAEMNELANSRAGAFITKTATLSPRNGNNEPRYFDIPNGSINSMGLPNFGIDYYLNYQICQQDLSADKAQFISVTGMNYTEIIDILKKVQASDYIGFTELNLSCPNLVGKPQIAYDFTMTEQLLSQIFTFFSKRLGVKLPPYFDMVHFDLIAAILNKFPLSYVNSINSIGNGLSIDLKTEATVIAPKNGFGGLGGKCVKATALANVRALVKRLNPKIKVIGTGGITSGGDVFEHILCGASLVQIGTQLHQEGPKVFERLENELALIMTEKGYQKIDDFRGKLKEL